MRTAPPPLRIGFVPGVEPDRFVRRWRQGPRPAPLELVPLPWSRQLEALADGEVDMAFVRLPREHEAADGTDQDRALLADMHAVRLWQERPVVVVSDENVLSLHEELTEAELAEEPEIRPEHRDDAKDRIAVVATGVGYTRVPMSLGRLHHRKDAVLRPLVDADPTTIALVWPRADDDPVRQEFVGVVRGRTIRSTR